MWKEGFDACEESEVVDLASFAGIAALVPQP